MCPYSFSGLQSEIKEGFDEKQSCHNLQTGTHHDSDIVCYRYDIDRSEFGFPKGSSYGFSPTPRVALIKGFLCMTIGLMAFFSYIFRDSLYERELDTGEKSTLIIIGFFSIFFGVIIIIGIITGNYD